jgi:hypothetical protein
VYFLWLGQQRRKGERGNSENVSALSATPNLARDGYIESTCYCVQARFLGMEANVLFSLLWKIQCDLTMYLKLRIYY